MPKFIAQHTIPYNEAQFMEMYKELAPKMAELPPGVSYNLTYCGFGDNKFFCDWDAPNKETLEQIFKMMEMPFDAIYPVKKFIVATGTFED